MVPIMEQRDIPIMSEAVEELPQSIRSFGKLEAKDSLMRDVNSAAYQVPGMTFGKFVVTNVVTGHVMLGEFLKHVAYFFWTLQRRRQLE
jgi:hypothetical protein